MNLDLEALGITRDELTDRVIERIAHTALRSISVDDNDSEHEVPSSLSRKLDELVKKTIDAAVTRYGDSHVMPKVTSLLESIIIQETNTWGEKKGEPKTFIEYLIERADIYLREKVDFQGKPKSDPSSHNWSAAQTRVTHMVHSHLQYSIETAMKEALKNANASIIGGINDAVKVKLAEVAAKFKVEVTIK